ncbi:HAD family hydrolase [Streptacidiphilus sp. MAP5-3]|uniref:HAD family hydrolase n=1 Tax=unclassified Streptacidiphilus TaxID=2643834 RepID=UPI00351527BD
MSATRSEADDSAALGNVSGPVPDPFATLDETLAGLGRALATDEWLDAFLWAAGALQIVEDRIDSVSWPPRRLLAHLAKRDGDSSALSIGFGLLDAAEVAYRASPPARALRAWAADAAALTLALAGLVLGDDSACAPQSAVAGRVLAGPGRGSRRLVGRDLLRPPACFRSFDQHPADVVALARRFSEAYPAREPPLLVLGIRTSGSYLAPLLAAALRRDGHTRVDWATTRPGAPLPGRAALAVAARVLLVDDPPVTGGSLADVAADLVREGVPGPAVVPVFACFDDPPVVPERLAGYGCVTLPGSVWHVRELLSPRALQDAAERLVTGGHVLDVRVPEPGPVSRAGHLRVPFDVAVAGPGGGRDELALCAEWTGVGRFGRLAVATADALDGLVPRIRGFADGVLLRDRLDDATATTSPVTPGEVAAYVARREDRLGLREDRSRHLGGRDPVWESAARTLAPVLGRAGVLLRPTLVQPLTRRLLAAAPRPYLVDGRTAPWHWAAGTSGAPRKLDWAEGGFASLDLACYDAAYDLAGFVAHVDVDGDGDDAAERELLDAYRDLTGRRIEPARWFLFQLVQAGNAVRLAQGRDDVTALRARARRAKARAAQRFLAGALLADLDATPADASASDASVTEADAVEAPGPWVVLDIDGVLETDALGFPASTPLGMLSLRALRAHGFRTVLATGRSLAEVRDRCAAYGLAGGVGEYGAVCFDAVSDRHRVVLDDARRAQGDGGLAALLASRPGHETDLLSRWCVRASVRRRDGRRTGLPEAETEELLRREPFARLFGAVPGDAQTDFVPRGADKAVGVRALFALMGEPAAPPLLAVGDGPVDLPLLRWSRHGAVPAHARRLAGRAPAGDGIRVTRGAYQAGLAEAVATLLGHRPGRCPVCRPPALPAETRAVLDVLALPEAGRSGALARLMRLALADAGLVARHEAELLQHAHRPFGDTPRLVTAVGLHPQSAPAERPTPRSRAA